MTDYVDEEMNTAGTGAVATTIPGAGIDPLLNPNTVLQRMERLTSQYKKRKKKRNAK